MANDFIVDIEGKQLVSNFLSTRALGSQSFVYGDQPTISVRLVEANSNDADLPWRQVDLTGKTIRVAIGDPGGDPTDGTYTLTFDGDTTSALNHDDDVATVQAALDLLASIVSAGGVTVSSTQAGSSGFRVSFDTVGAQTLITADTTALTPSSSAFIFEQQAGDGSTKEVQLVNFETDPAAYVELTDDMASPAVDVTTVRDGATGTIAEQQRIIITGDPYAGTYSLTFDAEESSAISFDASTDEIVTVVEALASIGVGNVTVTGTSLDYTIEFNKSLGDIGEGTGDASNLSGSIGKTGTLDLNVTGIIEILNGASTVQTKLEIVEFTISGSKDTTVFQQTCTVNQDVIPGTPASTTPLPDYPDRTEVFPVPKDVTGTSYTLDIGDTQSWLRTTNAASVAITVPPESSVDFDLGAAIAIEQAAAGQVTIVEGAGVTVNKPLTQTRTTRSLSSVVLLVKVAADEWTLSGDTDFE
jgi:hypothetical protein